MSIKNHTNKGIAAGGVNPQGYGQDNDQTRSPKSKLENAAKKRIQNKKEAIQ